MCDDPSKKDEAKDITPISSWSPGSLIFLTGQGINMLKNAKDQLQAIRGSYAPLQDIRIGAFAGTLKFAPGTVGSGTNSAIQIIHSIFGALGQEAIGGYFNHPRIQQYMAKPVSNRLANTAVAAGEYKFWCNVQKAYYAKFIGDFSSATFNIETFKNLLGGIAGSHAGVNFRCGLVQGLATSSQLMKGFQPRAIVGATGIIGSSMLMLAVKQVYTFTNTDTPENATDKITVIE